MTIAVTEKSDDSVRETDDEDNRIDRNDNNSGSGRNREVYMVETVFEHCKHPDCVYRHGKGEKAMCEYILFENKSRGCKISECDKYRRARKKHQRTDGFAFNYGIVEEDDDEV